MIVSGLRNKKYSPVAFLIAILLAFEKPTLVLLLIRLTDENPEFR